MVLVLNHYFMIIQSPKIIIISILYVLFVYNAPAVFLIWNYYKHNRYTEFEININTNEIIIFEKGISKRYHFDDVEYSVYNLGKYWKNAIDNNFRLPTLFSDFGYWDLTFKNGDRYFLTTLLHNFLLEKDKVKNTTYRFRLIPYIDKKASKEGIELKRIKFKPKSRQQKLREIYEQKTIMELEYVVENENLYKEEARKIASEILKEKNVG